MSFRRNWFLKQMGVTQYLLRRPRALLGEFPLTIPADLRLLIIADPLPEMEDPLVSDVLRAVKLEPDSAYSLTPAQLATLPVSISCVRWYLGTVPMSQTEPEVRFVSPCLAQLCNDVSAKRALWQQICEYDKDLITSCH